jgi:enoyl-CoA hydratase
MTDKILVARDGPVTTITINRPQVRNALDREAATALRDALRQFDEDPDARVAVLTGAGGAFCSGADLKELATGTQYEPWAGSADGPLHAPLDKPVIAAVTGVACAGGLGVALWCDLRVGDPSAKFAVLSRRWGVPMSDGTTVRLPRIVGMGHALDMLLSAKVVEAEEALRIGLITRLAAPGQAVAEAQQLARTIAAFPQIAMGSDRRSAYEQWDLAEAAAIANELAHSVEARRREAVAGAQRFAAGEGRHGVVAGGAAGEGAQGRDAGGRAPEGDRAHDRGSAEGGPVGAAPREGA